MALRTYLNMKNRGVISLVGGGGKTTLMFRLAKELSEAGESVLITTTTKIFRPSDDDVPHLILSDNPDEILDRAERLLKLLPESDQGRPPVIAAASGYVSKEKLRGFSRGIIDAIWNTDVFRWILVEADGAARRPLKVPARHEPLIPESSGWIIGLAGMDAVGKPLDERGVFRPERYASITGLSLGENVTEASVAAAFTHEKGIMKETGYVSPNRYRIVFLNKADHPAAIESARRIAGMIASQKKKRIDRVVIGKLLDNYRIMDYRDI